jgi:NADPH:quinone reductase-like Zn-dependent oxidoreductase
VRAVVQSGYGRPADVLRVAEVPDPVPADDEVVVRVAAASVHADVWHVITGRPWVLRLMGAGLRRPSPAVPGTDMAGTVEAVGRGVTTLRPGDEVFGETITGIQWHNGGAWADRVAVRADALATRPATVTAEQAATVPTAGIVTLSIVPERALRPGARVLVNGAGGAVGTIAVQLTAAAGAKVTAVDRTGKHAMLRALGAAEVVDHTVDDPTAAGGPHDAVVDVVGGHRYPDWRRVLAPEGTYVLLGHDHYGAVGRRWLGSIPQVVGLMARSLRDPHLPRPDVSAPDRAESMQRLRDALADGTLTPPVAARFPLEQAGEALALLASGEAAGRIVLVPHPTATG